MYARKWTSSETPRWMCWKPFPLKESCWARCSSPKHSLLLEVRNSISAWIIAGVERVKEKKKTHISFQLMLLWVYYSHLISWQAVILPPQFSVGHKKPKSSLFFVPAVHFTLKDDRKLHYELSKAYLTYSEYLLLSVWHESRWIPLLSLLFTASLKCALQKCHSLALCVIKRPLKTFRIELQMKGGDKEPSRELCSNKKGW